MQKDNFNNWYKSQFDKLNAEPPEHVWENVSARIDTDQVWTSISKTLDRKENRRKRRAVILVLLFLLGSSYLVLDNYVGVTSPGNSANKLNADASPVISGTNSNTEKSEVAADQLPVHSEKSSDNVNNDSDHWPNDTDSRNNDNNEQPVHLTERIDDDEVNPRNQVPAVNDAPFTGANPSREFHPIASIPMSFPISRSWNSYPLHLEMFEIPLDTMTTAHSPFITTGISCVGSFSGLIDHHYMRSLKKNTTNSVSITPDISGELFAEKITSKNLGVGGFINFNSTVEQTYHGYYEGQFLNNVVRLQTFRVGTYFALYWDRKTNRALGPENCFVAGITGNVITRKEYSGMQEEYYNPENLVNIYPGVMVGLRKYKSILPGLFAHAGINFETSITNVYSGEPGIPKDFFRTHIVTGNVTVGISYRFVNQH